jgi:hypothetical protein
MNKYLIPIAMACICSLNTARASLIIGVESANVGYSAFDQTGWLYVYLHSTDNPQPQLKGYDLRFNLLGNSGMLFLDAREPSGGADRGYLLPSGMAYTVTQESPTQITVSDLVWNYGNNLPANGAFIQFQYEVPGGTPIGSVGDIRIDTDYTDLAIASGQYDSELRPYTVLDGTINVVPEPQSITLVCAATFIFALLGFSRFPRIENQATFACLPATGMPF